MKLNDVILWGCIFLVAWFLVFWIRMFLQEMALIRALKKYSLDTPDGWLQYFSWEWQDVSQTVERANDSLGEGLIFFCWKPSLENKKSAWDFGPPYDVTSAAFHFAAYLTNTGLLEHQPADLDKKTRNMWRRKPGGRRPRNKWNPAGSSLQTV